MANLKILMVCGAGLGSSFACQMTTEDVINSLGVQVDLDHSDISSALSYNPDIIMTAENFRSQFANYTIDESKTTMIYLKNIVSKKEIEEKLTPVLKAKGVL
ncbi:PTS system IIB component (L-Asc family) [Breznakia blatticola]|uniref:PTS system IIB component (L-Asc family) n=1 Tax=Breznakia blatticola TaxID=1754012 RepID=A0A4R7ZGG1_9FIRM|nr:PTS sugar transporter subunit IIB [Breznakia blatticola]TDW16402.1 PTS system IIB component (L-Asc family) [Breznakia blatticola]